MTKARHLIAPSGKLNKKEEIVLKQKSSQLSSAILDNLLLAQSTKGALCLVELCLIENRKESYHLCPSDSKVIVVRAPRSKFCKEIWTKLTKRLLMRGFRRVVRQLSSSMRKIPRQERRHLLLMDQALLTPKRMLLLLDERSI